MLRIFLLLPLAPKANKMISYQLKKRRRKVRWIGRTYHRWIEDEVEDEELVDLMAAQFGEHFDSENKHDAVLAISFGGRSK